MDRYFQPQVAVPLPPPAYTPIPQPTIYRRQRNIGCPAPPQAPPIPQLVPPVQESDTTDDLPF